MIDSHTHTCFSNDSQAQPKDMIASAVRQNLRYLAFTDHIDFAPTDYKVDVPRYFAELEPLRQTKEVEVALGLEVGIQTSHQHEVNAFLKELRHYPCDVVIASLHRAQGLDIGDNSFMRGKNNETWWRELLEETLESMKSSPDFDVLGHLDMLRRYGDARGTRAPETLNTLLDEVLRWVIDHEKALEFNTSGFRYGLDSPHPETWIIERFYALGGRRVTFGSDAHRPEDVGHRHRESLATLRDIGFREICVFRNRRSQFLTIS